jgi:hypothetical protein
LCTHEGLTYVLTTDTTAGTPNAMPHSDTSRKPMDATFNPVPHSSTNLKSIKNSLHLLTVNELVALGINTNTNEQPTASHDNSTDSEVTKYDY